jgi:hypothetical protein
VNEVSMRAEAESEEVIAYNKGFKYYAKGIVIALKNKFTG